MDLNLGDEDSAEEKAPRAKNATPKANAEGEGDDGLVELD
jgi:hypothetical protein